MQRAKRSILIKFFLLSFLFSNAFIAFSQPPIEIPQGMEGIPGNFDPKNMSQPQLRALLEDKNGETGKDKNAELFKKNRLEKDSLVEDNITASLYSPKRTYGANVFANAATTSINELSTPPLDYPIGVGDQIIVSLWGAAELQEEYVVARDGSIFPTGLGKINVQGLTFENMRSVVSSRFRSVVPPSTNLAVSLGQPRTINVNVVGEVNNGGILTVSAFSNAFNVIARAGGITDFGNLRNIQIKRNGKVIDELDVYKYLTTGDFGKHIYLQNNDFVIVGFVEKKVLATGQFKRPMFYQLKKDEGVKALIKYAGGFSSEALGSALKIIRTKDEKQIQKDVNANAILQIAGIDEALLDGDIVRVDIIKSGIINKVQIQGEINYPSFYEIRKGDRLFDIINRAGGVTRNTYLKRAYVFRGAGDSTNLRADKLEIDLTDMSENISSENNVLLEPNDIIQLFSRNEFVDEQFVEIFGEIRKGGRYIKYGGMTLQDLLYLSGGIQQSAEFGRLEISSIVDIDSAKRGLKPTRTIVKAYAIQPDLTIDTTAAKVMLKPYDQIYVRQNPNFELQQNVEMKGLLNYPGSYPRLSKVERLSSFIERAGGFKDNANLSGAVLYRKKTDLQRQKIVEKQILDSLGIPMLGFSSDSIKNIELPISIDLLKALEYKNSKHDIILQEGDIVDVPEVDPFVSVQGTVQSPLKIAFDKQKTSLMYYIDKAGGFGVRPWRKRIFVTYANGKSRRTKTFLFFKRYPKVEEGATVMVPIRPSGQEIGDTVKSIFLGTIPVVITAYILRSL